MANPLRTVLLGNSFAERIQLPALRFAGDNEVVGIAGRDEEKARATAERWTIPHATARWRELLELDPDLVIVSTPVDLHEEMVAAALETRAAILCEKPFTLDAEAAARLRDAARGRLCAIDHQLRWSPVRRRMRELARQGYVGEVWNIRSVLVTNMPAYLRRPFCWWFERERGGGALGALASHLVDSILWMFGPARSVRARLSTWRRTRPDEEGVEHEVTADERASLWLRLESGAEVEIEACVATPGADRWVLEVSGSEGVLRTEDEITLLGAKHGDELEALPLETTLPSPDSVGVPAHGPFACLEPLYLRDLVAGIRAGRLPAEAASFEDGVRVMRVLDAARESARGAHSVACGP